MDYVSLPNRTSHLGVVTSSRKVWQKRTPRASGSGKHVGEYKPTHVGSSFTVLYLSRTLRFFAFRPAPQPPAVQGKPESLPNLVQATCGKPASSRRLRSCDVQNSSSPASRSGGGCEYNTRCQRVGGWSHGRPLCFGNGIPQLAAVFQV